MGKVYIVDHNGKWQLIKAKGFKPPNVVGEPPKDPLTGEYENPAWLQVEDIQDPETGQMVPTITVDPVKKAAVLAAEAQDKADKDKAKADDDAIVDKLLALDPDAIKDIEDIKSAFRDIKDYLGLKYKDKIKAKGK